MVHRPLTGPSPVGVVHVHSDFSHDGRDSLARLREFAADRGIGFVGLTDHAEDLTSERFEHYVSACAAHSDDAVQLLPGLEFRFSGFPGLHLLGLGLRRWIAPRTPEEFMRLASTTAGFTIVAHPSLAGYVLPSCVRAGVMAIEVWNAAYNTRYLPDPGAVELLVEVRRERPEVVAVAGLDQHDASNDRGTRVVLDRPSADPLAELRAGRFTNRGRTLRFEGHMSWGPVRLMALRALRVGLRAAEAGHDAARRVGRARR